LIAKGEVVANGSFDELKATQNKSLEQIFAQLTGSSDAQTSDMAGQFLDALK
jgi:ABC-type Na+ transport system ATPase subunit NatA